MAEPKADRDGGSRVRHPTGNDLETPALDRIVTSISSQLMAAESGTIVETIRRALARLGTAARVDRAYLMAFEPDGRKVELAAEWCAPGIEPVVGDLFGLDDDTARWWSARVLLGEPIFVADVSALEETDEPAAHLLRAEGVGSLVLVPVVIDGVPRGAIGMTTVRRTYHFSDDVAALLRLVGQTFINRLSRARAEQALESALRELGHRNAELERSNRELEQFAYVASHDLKSPLLVIRGFLDLLARSKKSELGDEGMSYVNAATRGAERMEHLIDALLAFSRAGRVNVEPSRVDLDDVVRHVLDDCTILLRDTHAEVIVGPLPKVVGDSVQLAQLFQNLVSNAVKYSRPGVDPQVSISANRVAGEWRISITDNGIGFEPDDDERIFQMFSRLEATRHIPGSGIGLAICQRVVQAHHGRVWVERPDGPGTRFVIALPVHAEASAGEPPSNSPSDRHRTVSI